MPRTTLAPTRCRNTTAPAVCCAAGLVTGLRAAVKATKRRRVEQKREKMRTMREVVLVIEECMKQEGGSSSALFSLPTKRLVCYY